MNAILSQTIDKYCVKFNKKITEGVSKELLARFPYVLGEIFQDALKNFTVPIKYEGFRYITPEEEFKMFILKNSNSKVAHDISESDLFPVCFRFSYLNEPIDIPLYLLYCERGNIFKLSGAQYSIIPVLSDTVISADAEKIFVRVLKNKFSIKQYNYNILVNGIETSHVVHHTGLINNNDNTGNKDLLGKMFIPIVLYPLGKYGLKETFKKYLKVDDFIVTLDNVNHLKDDYNIWQSTKRKPLKLKTHEAYLGHDLKICIPKKYKVTQLMNDLICGIIYALDVLPYNADNIIETWVSQKVDDEIAEWRIVLGVISYRNYPEKSKVIEDTDIHFSAVDDYVDSYIIKIFRHGGISSIKNFYDLMVYIAENFSTLMLRYKEHNSDITNKYIDITYYLLYQFIYGFNKNIQKLEKDARKATTIAKGGLSFREVQRTLKTNLTIKTVSSLTKSKNMNLALQACNDSSTDLMYPKITALLEDQSRGNGVNKGTETKFLPSMRILSGYDLRLGTLLFLNKKAPTPRLRVNVFMDYDIDTGKIIIPKDIDNTICKLNSMLKLTVANKESEDDSASEIEDQLHEGREDEVTDALDELDSADDEEEIETGEDEEE